MKYKVVIFGVKTETQEVINRFQDSIDLVVTLDEDEKSKYHISGGDNLRSQDIEFFHTDNYSLKSDLCKNFFSNNQFDIGIVVGWQRLIPKYILENFKHGVFGFHASPLGLPFGKGRSPANWSMILGFQQVYSHFFQYNEKADDGFIYSTKKLDILPWDNIFTLKQKILFHQMNSIEKLLNDYINNNIKLSNQDKTLPETFFPKREPSDGKIDLTKSTEKIFNLIRGCTKPFPGAFLYYDKNIIAIWDAVPFSYELKFKKYRIGEIVKMYEDESFIIKTIDGSLLIKKWTSTCKLKQHTILE